MTAPTARPIRPRESCPHCGRLERLSYAVLVGEPICARCAVAIDLYPEPDAIDPEVAAAVLAARAELSPWTSRTEAAELRELAR